MKLCKKSAICALVVAAAAASTVWAFANFIQPNTPNNTQSAKILKASNSLKNETPENTTSTALFSLNESGVENALTVAKNEEQKAVKIHINIPTEKNSEVTVICMDPSYTKDSIEYWTAQQNSVCYVDQIALDDQGQFELTIKLDQVIEGNYTLSVGTAEKSYRQTFSMIDSSASDTVSDTNTSTSNTAKWSGTKVVNGKTILYVNNKAVTGTKLVFVSGKTYAVINGYVKTGKKQLIKIGTKYYIVNKLGVVQKGRKNKIIKIGSKSYIVNKKGVVQKPKKGKYKLLKAAGKKYIVNKKGIVQKNKKSINIGKKTYRTNKKGICTLKK